MKRLSGADMMVIFETMRRSLQVADSGQAFTRETRELVLNRVLDVLDEIDVEFVTSKPDPINVSGDCTV